MTEISNLDIWRALKDKKPILDQELSDELKEWIKSQIDIFNQIYDTTDKICQLKYHTEIGNTATMSPQEVEEKIKRCEKQHQKIFFSMYNNKDYSQIIWKEIRPIYIRWFAPTGRENNYFK